MTGKGKRWVWSTDGLCDGIAGPMCIRQARRHARWLRERGLKVRIVRIGSDFPPVDVEAPSHVADKILFLGL
jgi:hypothetical protein